MRTVTLRLRESFWFLPAVFGVVAVVLAQVLVSVDRGLVDGGVDRIPFLDALSASGGRSILTTVGTSMLTVAGTSFSITISVLATTSSTYGPRLVRNFMADRANQVVLASFTSTFLYAIVVLRSVHTAVEDGSAFVPVIAIHAAVLFGIFDVGVLVFFIHHIASSVQITSLQKQVQSDLAQAIRAVFRSGVDERTTTGPLIDRIVGPRTSIRSDADGYVQSVHWERIVAWASEHDVVMSMTAMPGAFVIAGDELAEWGNGHVDAAAAERLVRACVTLGNARTPYQDVGFALQQLVEIAVRGLAAGTNDPYTAVSAFDLSAAVLVPMWRDLRAVIGYQDDHGRVRVIAAWPTAEELVDSVFGGVVTYGTEHPIVVDAAIRLALRLEEAAPSDRQGHLALVMDRLRTTRE